MLIGFGPAQAIGKVISTIDEMVYLVFDRILLTQVEPNDTDPYTPTSLKFIVQTQTYWSWVLVSSMRSGQPGINGKQYATLPIPLPPTVLEQEQIAESIDSAEILSESLKSLISKKRDIKQGTMQKLLTGKTRLPGFSSEWKSKRLGDSATLKARIGWQGLTTAEYIGKFGGNFFLIGGTEFNQGFIDWNSCFHVERIRYEHRQKYTTEVRRLFWLLRMVLLERWL